MASILGYEPRRAIRGVIAQRLFGANDKNSTAVRDAPRMAACQVEWVEEPDQLVPTYARHPARLVLIGTDGGNRVGVDLVRRLLAAYPSAVVIVLGGAKDRHSQQAALTLGARGFLRLNDILEPDSACTQVILGAAATTQPDVHMHPPAIKELTKREHQILIGMSRGLSNQKIGLELFLSEDTVKTHARRLYGKLHVNDRAAAVAAGFRHRILH